MSKDVREALLRQKQRFSEKFGRDPEPDDPVFFDENADEPQPISTDRFEREITDYLIAINVDPALIHAFQVTGRLVTENNLHLLTQEELEEWNAAVEQYRVLHPSS
jgi:hypothetical protein